MGKRLFYTVNTLSWFCSVLGVTLDFTTRSQLPDVLFSYVVSRQPVFSHSVSILLGLLVIILSIASLISSFGIYFWQRWARLIYTLSVPIGLVLLIIKGNYPLVQIQWVGISGGLSYMFSGITLCAMWFVPDILERFKPEY